MVKCLIGIDKVIEWMSNTVTMKQSKEWGMMIKACNPSIQMVDVEKSKVQNYPWVQGKFQNGLKHMRTLKMIDR